MRIDSVDWETKYVKGSHDSDFARGVGEAATAVVTVAVVALRVKLPAGGTSENPVTALAWLNTLGA